MSTVITELRTKPREAASPKLVVSSTRDSRTGLPRFVPQNGPSRQIKNPVMFIVLVGSIITFVEAIAHPGIFTWSITVWLVLTVLFANFAEAMAEGRGKAQADTLRKMRSETEARRFVPTGPRNWLRPRCSQRAIS